MSRARRRAAHAKGHRAELAAAAVLALKGYRILARRYRCALGEIDLVARRGRRYAFIEVKVRESAEAGALAVSVKQQHRIARAASQWLARNAGEGDYDVSFDVVLITPWAWPLHVVDAFRV